MNAIGAEVRRSLFLARSYWIDYIADLILYTLGFLLLMAVYSVAAGDAFEKRLILNTLIGYITWKVAASTMFAIAQTAVEENKTGTLEQLLITGQNPGFLILRRGLTEFLDYGIRGLILGGVLAAILGLFQPIRFSVLVFFFLSVMGAFGLGFILSGLVLVFKRISGVLNLTWQMLVFFTGALAPIPESVLGAFSKLLPLTWGINAMRASLVDSASLDVLWADGTIPGLLINTGAYILIGAVVFRWGYNRARSLGTLGQY